MADLKEFKFLYIDDNKEYVFTTFAKDIDEAILNIVKFGRRFTVDPDDAAILGKISRRLISKDKLRLLPESLELEDKVSLEDSVNEIKTD